ncbi:hypothetical protein SHIRM173S_12643 [Streptomyces hirsutus]
MAAACTRQGAVLERLPARRLLATQFAAGAANHLLPTGLGASAVNLRFMTVCGLSLTRSSAALALYLLAESVGRVALLGALLVAFPDVLRPGSLLPEGALGPALLALGAVLVVAAAVLALVRRIRTAVFSFLRTALGEALVGAHPAVEGTGAVGRGPRVPGAAGGGADPGGAGAGTVGTDRAHGGGVSRGDRRGRAGAHAGRASVRRRPP